MSYPAPPPYATVPPPPPPPPPSTAGGGAGLAISSLVLGVVALVLCWIPIVNNIAALIALVGLGLGIPALVLARRGKRDGTGIAVAGVVTSAVALLLVLVTQALFMSAVDSAVEDIQRAATEGSGAVDTNSAGPGQDAADPVPLGTAVTVGSYEVSVDDVLLDADDLVASASEWNEPPTGQYVVVTLTATYAGTEDGTPGMDLRAVFNGNDARQYSDSDCSTTLPQDAMDVPTLNEGGTATFQFCMDVPPAAISGGSLFLEPTWSFDDERTFFAVR